MAMASPAIGQRPYPLLLDPEPPHYLQSLSGPEPPPPPPDRSSRRCVPAPLSTAPGAHEGRSARRAARGNLEPPPRASRPARPLRPGLQQRLRRRPGAPRPRDVRSIFEQPQDPRVPAERGEGHCFAELVLPGGPGWCDLCGREVLRQALRCANCKFTCHPECRSLIRLDCSQQEGSSRDRPSPESTLTLTFSQRKWLQNCFARGAGKAREAGEVRRWRSAPRRREGAGAGDTKPQSPDESGSEARVGRPGLCRHRRRGDWSRLPGRPSARTPLKETQAARRLCLARYPTGSGLRARGSRQAEPGERCPPPSAASRGRPPLMHWRPRLGTLG
ncbi:ras association domain-containing protein 5-like [Piliocolobus tephrosceles]|uniref:ras association domain-containing protein 5-like n=1 Tax=Piliocolobus tephrosceles TaxID=591936 RepID=UPI000C2AE2B2|nr:ras association domain-containing protein 5-like [Piliocolobus tephrosceles]